MVPVCKICVFCTQNIYFLCAKHTFSAYTTYIVDVQHVTFSMHKTFFCAYIIEFVIGALKLVPENDQKNITNFPRHTHMLKFILACCIMMKGVTY